MAFRLIRSNLDSSEIADLVAKLNQGEYRVTSYGMVIVDKPKEGHPTASIYIRDSSSGQFVKEEIPLPVGYAVGDRAGLANTDQTFLKEDHRKLEEIMKTG